MKMKEKVNKLKNSKMKAKIFFNKNKLNFFYKKEKNILETKSII